MAIIANTRSVFATPCRFVGTYRFQQGETAGGGRMMFAGGVSGLAAIPLGALAPRAFLLPQKSGGIASLTGSGGTLTGSGILNLTRPMLSTASLVLTGSGSINPVFEMLANGTLLLTGSSTASAAAFMLAARTLQLTGLGQIGAIIQATANGTGTLSSNTTLLSTAFMYANGGGATPLSPEGLTAELLDNQEVETGMTLREALRIILTAVAGKVSGAGTTTVTFRNTTDTKSRIIADVDTNGNRISVALDTTEG